MNARFFILTLVFSLFVLASCAPAAATQAPIASQPKTTNQQPAAHPTAARRQQPATTQTPPPSQSPEDNYFQSPGINGPVGTRRDHLSTFAVDVDTASYTVARRYIQDGSLPPADAVRVEEYVNYFDPGYASPADSAFSIYADGAPSPFHRDGTYLLRVGVQGYRVPDRLRKPSSLTFVIDVSGSMDLENRLGLVQQSLELLINRLGKNDTIGIIAYDTNAWVVLEPTSIQYRDEIIAAIYTLRPGSSTNLDGGLRLGFQQAMAGFNPDGNNRIILCSDGVANTGNVDPDTILEYVGGFIREGISLSTYGFGMGNFNDALLERLADKGNGSYAYIDTEDEARRLFIDQLSSTLQTIAKDAKIQVDFNPDVVATYRLLGYENRAVADQDFRNDSVDAGEIGAGHHVVAVYAVQLKAQAEGRIATVQLRWEDPDSATVEEINGNVNTWDLAINYQDTDPYYKLIVTVAQFAEILRGSPYAGETTLPQLAKMANEVRRLLPENDDAAEFADLVRKAAYND